MTGKGRNAAPTTYQKAVLTDFMRDHPHLVKGTFTNTFSHKLAQTLWEEISEKLNAMPGGAKKDWKKWRKTWQDLKKLTKSKLVEKRKWQNKTGGGPAIEIVIDENVADLIDNKEVEGHMSVAEPEINFQFGGNSEEMPQTPKVSAPPNPTPNNVLSPSPKMASPTAPAIDSLGDLIIEIENYNQKNNNNDKENNSNDKQNLEMNIEHNYAIDYPDGAPKKKMTQTQRLQTSLKLSQQLVKGVDFRNNILDKYYSEKIAFLKHKTQNDLKLVEAVNQLSKSIDENTQQTSQQTKALLQILFTNVDQP